jgi:hypothetical protein
VRGDQEAQQCSDLVAILPLCGTSTPSTASRRQGPRREVQFVVGEI